MDVFKKGFEKVNVPCFVASPVVKLDVVAYVVAAVAEVKYELKSRLRVLVVLVNGAENVKAFSFVFNFFIVA